MKKYLFISALFAALISVSCENQDYVEADYNVRLNEANTYRAGEPVRFDISGNVDNLLFYSGEMGHEYKYYNRYVVAPSDIRSAQFVMDIQCLYGYEGALDVYLSDTFDGLTGTDAEADRNRIREMVENGMEGWVKCDYQDGTQRVWYTHEFDLKEYVDKCTIALHWHPTRTNPETEEAISQRTYWINADLITDFGQGVNSVNIRNIEWTPVMMNSYYDADPYAINKGNGYINFNKSGADLILQGVSNTALDFDIDGWLISDPMPLTAVQNDQPLVIKDMQNRLMLDDAASEKFSSVYKEYLQALKDCREKGTKERARTDSEIMDNIKAGFDTQKKIAETKEKYFNKMKSFLNAKQLEIVFCNKGRRPGYADGRRPEGRFRHNSRFFGCPEGSRDFCPNVPAGHCHNRPYACPNVSQTASE